jgi:hypothetical protein
MTNTDIDGRPILILSLEEAALAHVIVASCDHRFGQVQRLDAKLSRFLEEANENGPDKETG